MTRCLLLSLLLASVSFAETPIQILHRAQSDIAYKQGDGLTPYETERCQLDVYLPLEGRDWPVLVWFHGGGLKKGDKRGTPEDGVKTERIAESLARAGVAVVCPNYRFSPTVTFPTYIEDAAASVAWTVQNIAEHGGDPERTFIGGHSAGGYLAFMLGLDDAYLAEVGLKLSDIAGLIPVSGQTMNHYTVREERGIGKYTVTADEAAPVYHLRKDAPPMLVIYGDNDLPARANENEYFIDMMKAAGHKTTTGLLVKDRNHGTIASEIEHAGDPAREAILEFLDQGVPQP